MNGEDRKRHGFERLIYFVSNLHSIHLIQEGMDCHEEWLPAPRGVREGLLCTDQLQELDDPRCGPQGLLSLWNEFIWSSSELTEDVRTLRSFSFLFFF